ncbi:MAG: hypothetical protein V1849_03435 [Chloroflexota bacterium]
MVKWQVTAATIHCPQVADEVTLMVFQDGSRKCTGSSKYCSPGREMARLMREKSQKLKQELRCAGENCAHLAEYRDRLFKEEEQTTGK